MGLLGVQGACVNRRPTAGWVRASQRDMPASCAGLWGACASPSPAQLHLPQAPPPALTSTTKRSEGSLLRVKLGLATNIHVSGILLNSLGSEETSSRGIQPPPSPL